MSLRQVTVVLPCDGEMWISWVRLWGSWCLHNATKMADRPFLTDTVFAVWCKFITLIAQTLEGADFIEASAVSAHLSEKWAAFVYVCKQREARVSEGASAPTRFASWTLKTHVLGPISKGPHCIQWQKRKMTHALRTEPLNGHTGPLRLSRTRAVT